MAYVRPNCSGTKDAQFTYFFWGLESKSDTLIEPFLLSRNL